MQNQQIVMLHWLPFEVQCSCESLIRRCCQVLISFFIYLFIYIFSIMFFSSSTSAKQLEHQKYSKLATFSTAKSLRASAVFVLAAASFEFESRTLWLPVNSWKMATPAASQRHYCKDALYKLVSSLRSWTWVEQSNRNSHSHLFFLFHSSFFPHFFVF